MFSKNNKWVLVALLLLILLAVFLRVFFIFDNAVSFHYDMARDAFIAKQIWQEHDLKIIGPPTSTPGLYHGVLYYYLIAPFYGLGNGDPRVVAFFLSVINSLAIIPIFLLTKDLLKDDKWGLLAGLLFAVAFEAVQYGPWLSNPAPTVFTIAMFFYSLRLWQNKNRWGLPLAVFWAAISVQFQFFLIFLFILLPIFKFLFKAPFNRTNIIFSLIIGFLLFSSFFISVVKFNTFNQILNSFTEISANGTAGAGTGIKDIMVIYFSKYTEIFINNFYPTNSVLGGVLGILTLYIARYNKFILFALLFNLPIFIYANNRNPTFVNLYGMVIPAVIGTTVLLRRIFYWNKVLFFIFLSLIIYSNLYTIGKMSPEGQVALVIPKGMVLNQQLKLADETYRLAEGKPFSINTLTLPLWTNTTWAYLYWWYGKNKYGYVPSFYGHDQIGLLGKDSLKRIEKPLPKTFFIIEPADGIPLRFYNEELNTENSKTQLIHEIDYGAIKLQAREPKNNGQ